MNPADEEAAKIEPTEGQSSGAVAGSNDQIEEQLGATLKELQRNQSKLAEDLQSHFLRISHHLDYETSERKAIHDRLRAIDNQTKRTLESQAKRQGSRGFVRYLVAICVGVAATLAWQSYGETAKQIVATRAPELGWSPEAEQMIASSIQWYRPVPKSKRHPSRRLPRRRSRRKSPPPRPSTGSRCSRWRAILLRCDKTSISLSPVKTRWRDRWPRYSPTLWTYF
jgi:hypothetical protein